MSLHHQHAETGNGPHTVWGDIGISPYTRRMVLGVEYKLSPMSMVVYDSEGSRQSGNCQASVSSSEMFFQPLPEDFPLLGLVLVLTFL